MRCHTMRNPVCTILPFSVLFSPFIGFFTKDGFCREMSQILQSFCYEKEFSHVEVRKILKLSQEFWCPFECRGNRSGGDNTKSCMALTEGSVVWGKIHGSVCVPCLQRVSPALRTKPRRVPSFPVNHAPCFNSHA